MLKKRIATMGLVMAMAVMTFGSSLTVFAAEGSKYNDPNDSKAGEPASGDTGVFIQDAGYVPPDHPGYNPASYEFEVPTQLLYAMKYDGTLVGGWMQYENEDYKKYGEIKNHSQLPIQITDVKFIGNEKDWNFTDASGENYVHFVINANRNDGAVSGTTILDSAALLNSIDTSREENFHLFYENIPDKSDIATVKDDGTGVAYKVTHDIKLAAPLGTITWTVNGDSFDRRVNDTSNNTSSDNTAPSVQDGSVSN